jgi:hypothetical protein
MKELLEVDLVSAALPFIAVITILDPKKAWNRRSKAEKRAYISIHTLPLLRYCG